MNLIVLHQQYNNAAKNNQIEKMQKIDNQIEGLWEKFYNEIQKAQAFEKNKDVDSAILIYEKLIKMGVDSNLPYERLAILYRKEKKYYDEEKVLLNAIQNYENLLLLFPDRHDLEPKLIKFKERYKKLQKYLK